MRFCNNIPDVNVNHRHDALLRQKHGNLQLVVEEMMRKLRNHLQPRQIKIDTRMRKEIMCCLINLRICSPLLSTQKM